jgi:uncharacterized membrane protein
MADFIYSGILQYKLGTSGLSGMAISKAYIASVIGACIAAAGCADQVAALKKSHAIARGAPEACYGISRAGHNDCKTDSNVCAGWSRHNSDQRAYIYLPSGTCERIVGGKLSPPAAAEPARGS